jgi:hypothetical protein
MLVYENCYWDKNTLVHISFQFYVMEKGGNRWNVIGGQNLMEAYIVIYTCMYSEVLNSPDKFTALHFTAAGVLRGAYEFYRWISWCLKWSGVINLWTAWRYYITWQVMRFMHGSLRFVSSRQQLSTPLAICSQLQLVSSVVHHGVVYSRVTCISVWQLCEIQICWKL